MARNVVRELLARFVHLRRTTPCIQMWGANTDVGKTLMSVGLVGEVLRRAGGRGRSNRDNGDNGDNGHRALYLKPMQTGYPVDSDARKVLECNPGLETGSAKTLFTYEPPVSPHLCGDRPTDEELVRAVLETMVSTMGEALDARNGRGLHAVVETFGGPGSPMPSRTMQVDALRPLFLPAMLVGDAKLGGISTTLSSYEMIKSRGYPVRGVCMLHDARLRNHEVVQRHVDEEVIVLDPPEDDGPLRGAFLDQEGWRALFDVCFGPEHEARDQDIDGKKARARDRIWWPFTQHAALGDGAVDYISHRSLGDHIVTDDAVLFDASASWWTQGMSAELMPGLSAAVGSAIGRYGHVLFPRNVHDPALDLTEGMLSHPSHSGYARAFFSDDGSTAVEVGLKMAFRKFLVDRSMLHAHEGRDGRDGRVERPRIGVLGVDGSYHGDTLGTMDAVPPSVFTELQTPWTEARGLFLEDVPCVWMTKDGLRVVQGAAERPLEACSVHELFRAGAPGGATRRIAYESTIEARIDEYERRTSAMLGACIIEPVVQGAGGMRLIDPEFHRAMDTVCKRRNIPVVADEVFAGLWRLGVESAAVDLLGIQPDVGCFAKLLTAGIVPLSLTLATEEVFDAFKGDSKALALLHGHSYTAHPVGCAAANYALGHLRDSPAAKGHAAGDRASAASEGGRVASIDQSVHQPTTSTEDDDQDHGRGDNGDFWDAARVEALCRHPRVQGCWALGTVVSVKLVSGAGGYESSAAERVTTALRPRGISARPLGDVVYFMATPFTNRETCDWALDELLGAL